VARTTEKTAPSVEEAVEAALVELGVSEQEVVIEVVQEPRTGFLGVGGHEAVVRVTVRTEPTVLDEAEPDVGLDEAELEALEDQADAVADFLEELLAKMGVDAAAEPGLEGDRMYVDIVVQNEDDAPVLIGRHGQTLEAIQELSRLIVGRRLDERVHVLVDVEDYRKRRDARLAQKATEAARRVARSGREEELEPMNPFERKIAHDAVAKVPGAESFSRGEEPDRFVVIRKR
jgi:spoIIIJ-associated protein